MADGDARLRRLDDALKASFSNIKEDITNLDQRLSFQLNSLKEMKKELEDSQKDFVTIDKINIIKIKIGDLKEELKALYRIEKELKETKDKSADKDKTDKEIDEIKKQLDSAEKTLKTIVTDNKFQKLVDEINSEFKEIRKSIHSVEEKGGSIVKGKLSKLEKDADEKYNLLNNKIDIDLKNRYNVINKKMEFVMDELQNRTTKQQVNQLVRDVNKEFDSVKEVLYDIQMLKKDLKNVRRDKLGKAYFEQQIEGLKQEIEKLRRKSGQKESGKEKGWLRRIFSVYFFANLFIVLAFISLAASLAMYLIDLPGLMDYFIYTAVGLFILGIILRVIVVIRG